MLLTGMAACCGSGVVAGGSAACQILAESRTIAIPQGSMNAITMGPLADCAAAASKPTANRAASHSGTLAAAPQREAHDDRRGELADKIDVREDLAGAGVERGHQEARRRVRGRVGGGRSR